MLIQTHRRTFLKSMLGSASVISLSGAVPGILLGASEPTNRRSDNVMVVIQLTGGNDGLNTVIPFGDDEYYKNRFTLAIGKGQVRKIDDHLGFHPSLGGLSKLMEDQQLAVVQSVGYPNPNRSHFESMDLWHTAHQMKSAQPVGWLGRMATTSLKANDLPALHLGGGLQPLALKTDGRPIPSIRSIDNFRLKVAKDEATKQSLNRLIKSDRKTENSLLSYVHESAQIALATSHRLETIPNHRPSKYQYPGTELGGNLNVIANLIESGLNTSIYYVTLDGFDTHSNQAQSHAGLLSNFSDSLSAFMKQLTDQGNSKRVSVLAFSEFGRRVRENASRGTDHGAAAPLFVCGDAVKGRVIGDNPDLKNLDQEGDMSFKIDYRQVYTDLLTNWLNVDAEPIVGGKYQPIGLFKDA